MVSGNALFAGPWAVNVRVLSKLPTFRTPIPSSGSAFCVEEHSRLAFRITICSKAPANANGVSSCISDWHSDNKAASFLAPKLYRFFDTFSGCNSLRDARFHATRHARSLSAEATPIVQAVAVPTDRLKLAPTSERLIRLRYLMLDPKNNLDAYIVPSEDAHQSEYVASCDLRRVFISGFTGSAGLALITRDKALLWTDGRYYLHAERELDSNWTLMRAGLPDTPTLAEWLAENLPENARVGVDATVMSVAMGKQLRNKLGAKKQTLVPLAGNLIDIVWGSARPAAPFSRAIPHPVELAGQSTADKVAMVRGRLSEVAADALVVTTLDEIAWLLNMRGFDVSFNPVTIAYAVVTADAVFLYVDERKVEDVVRHWNGVVTVRPYTAVFDDVKALVANAKVVMVDPGKCNLAIHELIPPTQIVEQPSPITLAKACKNDAELAGMRNAHIRDAVAVCKFLCRLEEHVTAGGTLTEVEAGDKLEAFRREQDGFVSLSFDTIAGSGPNGAIIHYRAEPTTCGVVSDKHMFLLDSGAQYTDGTTDVTRTMHFGAPTAHQRECFTRVLKGHIALSSATFPRGITGYSLDVLARTPLWGAGLDYRHGTGHGVGAFLNVHEGPQSISQRPVDVALQPGMVVSNEPGYYEDGAFGIRIENLMVVRAAETPFNFGGVGYLAFDYLTLIPMQKRLMEVSLMSPAERQWIDSYHARVLDTLGPLLADLDKQTYAWLLAATAPLQDADSVATEQPRAHAAAPSNNGKS